MGYLSSKYVNTKYDSKTVTAVKNFQKRAGLTANGVADHKTQVALYAGSAPQPTVKPTPTPKPTATPRPTAKPTPAPTLDRVELPDDKVNKNTTLCYGSRNNQVILLSNRLRVLGYYDGSLTNRFDEVIEASVKWFQRVNKLTVDGVAGQRTLKRLYSPSAQRATGDPEPLKYRTKPVKVSGTPVKPKLNPVRNIDWFDNQTAAYFGKGGPLAVGAVYTDRCGNRGELQDEAQRRNQSRGCGDGVGLRYLADVLSVRQKVGMGAARGVDYRGQFDGGRLHEWLSPWQQHHQQK